VWRLGAALSVDGGGGGGSAESAKDYILPILLDNYHSACVQDIRGVECGRARAR
jgi:hypothetical protein